MEQTTENHTEQLINGTLSFDDDHTVAFHFDDGSFCSGVMVSPRVMVTAAHCFDGKNTMPKVRIGPEFFAPITDIAVTAFEVHPSWQGTFNTGGDIAVALLAQPHPSNAFAEMLGSGESYPVNGNFVRRVGFGGQSRGSPPDGKRRQGETKVVQGTQDLMITHGGVVTCHGDSGGPVFFTKLEKEYLVAVHSWGKYTSSGTCIGGADGATSLAKYVDGFIRPYVQQHDAVCLKDFYCNTACQDDPDCSVCGDDGVCTEGCDLPDPDCATQEFGEICQRDSQCLSGVCVAWESSPSSKFCSISCDSNCPDGSECENTLSHGDVCYLTFAPAGVAGDQCAENTDCGSYQCIDGMCLDSCSDTLGKDCPSGFSCSEGICFLDEGDNQPRRDPNEPSQQQMQGCRASSPSSIASVLFFLVCCSFRYRPKFWVQ